ncbi:hypothetical protein ACU8DI_03070 [Psychroserpens sp. BH13MA-6]
MKSLKLFVLLITVSMLSFSCGNDDDNQNSSSNKLIFGDTEYQLRAGVIEDYGAYSEGIYNFDIVLLNSEINNVDGEFQPVNETFSGVYFELFTDNSENLAEGTYTFGDNIDVGTYVYAEVFINTTVDNYSAIDITSGTFTVLDNGTTYEFVFEGTVDGGASFSGYYKGSLSSYDSQVVNGDKLFSSETKAKSKAFKN